MNLIRALNRGHEYRVGSPRKLGGASSFVDFHGTLRAFGVVWKHKDGDGVERCGYGGGLVLGVGRRRE